MIMISYSIPVAKWVQEERSRILRHFIKGALFKTKRKDKESFHAVNDMQTCIIMDAKHLQMLDACQNTNHLYRDFKPGSL